MPLPYPSIDEVNAADKVQLARWLRFLQPPGMSAKDEPDEALRADISETQRQIMVVIGMRFDSMGAWDPELSKQVGWVE